MTKQDLISMLKEKVREELQNEADKIIEKLVDIFRSELLRKKNSIIAGMINGLEVLMKQETGTNNITIQINLTPKEVIKNER